MADENEDTPMRTEDESGSGSGSGSDDESEEEQVEWLATTREKRSTAGNRMNSLLQQEGDEDDELELLFAEADGDVGFSDVDADSDVQMDSSSDDEDQGPAVGDEDLEGEKELQRQAKIEKAKKRKMDGGIPKIFKKKVKIDPTVSHAPPPRPKKKSERASWLPTAEEAPTRASARGTTRKSKQQLHMQMVDREIKRLRQLANMEKAAAAKEAAKRPAMTQADRLAEAARVEKSNSKSLSRWEEAEQQREADLKAKLAALHDRTLEGPVITWWSGKAEWVGGKLKQVGKNLIVEEKEKPITKKRKAAEMDGSDAGSVAGVAKGDRRASVDGNINLGQSKKPEEVGKVNPPSAKENGISDEKEKDNSSIPNVAPPPPLISKESTSSDSPGPDTTLSTPPVPKISNQTPDSQQQSRSNSLSHPSNAAPPPHSYPSYSDMSHQTQTSFSPPFPITSLAPPPPKSSVLAPPAGLPLTAPPLPPHFHQNPFSRSPYTLAPPSLDGSAPVPGLGYNFSAQLPRFTPSPSLPYQMIPKPPEPEGPPPPPAIEHATRNYLILQNFDETLIKDKNVQTQILFNRKFQKVPRSKKDHELCAITGYPAKYRDPHTGLPYCNSYAYKEIQKLKKGEYRWSKLVGVYVGPATYAARGVPERFKAALVQPKPVAPPPSQEPGK